MFYFDHVIIRIPNYQLPSACRVLSHAGFLQHMNFVEKSDGTRNAFFLLSGTYIELNGVREDGPTGVAAALAARTNDINGINRALKATIEGLPPVEFLSPATGADMSPAWAIQRLPAAVTPGCEFLVIEYLRGIGRELVERKGRNCIYALGGVAFLARNPLRNASYWYDLLNPLLAEISLSRSKIKLSNQKLVWHQCAAETDLGPDPETLDSSLFSIELMSDDMECSVKALGRAGFLIQDTNFGLTASHDIVPGLCFVLSAESNSAEFIEILRL